MLSSLCLSLYMSWPSLSLASLMLSLVFATPAPALISCVLIFSILFTPFISVSVLSSRSSPVSLSHSRSPELVWFFLTFLDHLLVQGRPVFQSSSIFDLVPCLQSVGISSCLPVCCPSISVSVDLGSFFQKLLVATISHRCGWVLASSSGQTTLLFSRKLSTGFINVCLFPDVSISDVVQTGLPWPDDSLLIYIYIYCHSEPSSRHPPGT